MEETRGLITLIVVVVVYNLNFHERIYFKSHNSCPKVLEENYFPIYVFILGILDC